MKKTTAIALVASLAAACGGEHTSAASETPENSPMRDAFGFPDEFDLPGGQRMRRVDLWDPAELERVIEAGAVRNPQTPEDMAEALRSHTLTSEGGYYIQVEPDLEMAKKVLAAQALLESRDTPENALPKRIIGTDNRVEVDSGPGTGITAAIGLTESGGTVNLMSAQVAVTAAHVVYATGSNRWICRTGSLDDGTGPVCTESHETGIPRHRYGVYGNNGTSSWTGCYTVSVLNSFVALTNSSFEDDVATVVANDVAFITYCNPVPHGDFVFTGYSASNSEIAGNIMWNFGYPAYAPCKHGQQGAPRNTDCTEGTWQLRPAIQPFTGGDLWGSLAPAGSAWAGSDGEIRTWIDTTAGQSGSALFFIGGEDGQSAMMIGVLHGGNANDNFNRFHRMTALDGFFLWAHIVANGVETFHR